jgi:hypothetical protein
VDLSDVTFVDEQGERLLSEMRGAGVSFITAGIDTKDLIDGLARRGERPLRRLLKSWAHPCGGAANKEGK